MTNRHETEAPATRGSWLLPLALASLGALGWACQDGGSGMDGGAADDASDDGTDPTDGSDGTVDRQAVLQSIATNVLVPATTDFATQAASLQTSVDAYAGAVASDPGSADAALQDAQAQWHGAMDQWQQLELMQVGPAASSLAGVGGEDLRDAIYSWPTADTCAVDRALVNEDYAEATFFQTELVWAYGLDALEYLLFGQGDAHTCPTQVQLDGPWAALGADELASRRAEYAAVVAGHIAEQASTLATRWDPAGDDFAAALSNPGQGASPYANDTEALDEVFRAMFYIDKQTKDGKLGLPLGLIDGCDAVPCIEVMETPWSGDAAPAVAANLRALRSLVQGGPDAETAVGFDDLLHEMGHGDVGDTLLAQIDAAIAVAEATESPLQETASADMPQVEALHAAVKTVTDTLKGPFVMALMLTIPAEGAGDHD